MKKFSERLKHKPNRSWERWTIEGRLSGCECEKDINTKLWFFFLSSPALLFFLCLCGGLVSLFPPVCCREKKLVAETAFFREPSKVLSEFLQQSRLKEVEDVNKIQVLRCCWHLSMFHLGWFHQEWCSTPL